MTFIDLINTSQLDEVFLHSYTKAQVIFKHSTRCSISSMVLNRVTKFQEELIADFHYLDLIQFRDLSDLIAERCDVIHESPQVLIIKNGKCIHHASHTAINMSEIIEHL